MDQYAAMGYRVTPLGAPEHATPQAYADLIGGKDTRQDRE